MKTIEDVIKTYPDLPWIDKNKWKYLSLEPSKGYFESCYLSVSLDPNGKLVIMYFPNAGEHFKEIQPEEIARFHNKEIKLRNFI